MLYCAVKRVSPASQVNAMLFTTGLAPLISDLLLRYPNAEAVGFHWAGLLLISFVLPAVLCPLINQLCRKAGWVKDGDLKLP